MYQALYRKYRPTKFSEVVGQEVITKTLKNAITRNKLTHAYLFTGPRGTGKTTIAKILAKTINCTKLEDIEPCDECVSCTEITKKQTTDIIEIDAASNNGVDEIREIRNKVNLVPSTSKYKVYIIDEVHMLTVGAFNALLKTLEEPPAHVIFILATTEPHKIPSTILSRCQRFDFKKVPIRQMTERLKLIATTESIQITEEALKEIAYLSDGGMRDAISTLDKVIAYADNEITVDDIYEINGTISKKELLDFTQYLFDKNIMKLLELIDKYNETGKNFVKINEELINFLKNLLLYKTVPDYFNDENHEYEQLEKTIETSLLINLIEILNDATVKLKNASDPTIIFELILIKFLDIKENNCLSTSTAKEQKNQPPNNIASLPKIEDKKETISNENHQEPLKQSKIDDSRLQELQNIRINNTLAELNKKVLIEIKGKIDLVNDLILYPEYSQFVSLILDGELKAASPKSLVFVYNNEILSNRFNQNIIIIEELIEKTYQNHYKVIATDIGSWELIREEYNSKKKEYKYIEEKINLQELLASTDTPNTQDDLNAIFGDIVEYS